MRVVDSASYNRVLESRISKLKDKSDKITPENVNYLPEYTIASSSDTIRVSSQSVINSMQMDTIHALIRDLKGKVFNSTTVTESLSISDFKDELSVSGNGTFVINVDVPSEFDGRNSFPYISMGDYDPFTEMDYGAWIINAMNRAGGLEYGGTAIQTKSIITTITPNKNRVIFNIDVNYVREEYIMDNDLNFNIFLWRNK
jgi:hypothetical protein